MLEEEEQIRHLEEKEREWRTWTICLLFIDVQGLNYTALFPLVGRSSLPLYTCTRPENGFALRSCSGSHRSKVNRGFEFNFIQIWRVFQMLILIVMTLIGPTPEVHILWFI